LKGSPGASCHHHKNAEFASDTARRGECRTDCKPLNRKEKICCKFAAHAQMGETEVNLWFGIGRPRRRLSASSSCSIVPIGERIYSRARDVAL